MWVTQIKVSLDPWLAWLSGWVLACEAKGHLFDSQSRARAWVVGQVPSGGVYEKATTKKKNKKERKGNYTSMFLSLSFSLPSPL